MQRSIAKKIFSQGMKKQRVYEDKIVEIGREEGLKKNKNSLTFRNDFALRNRGEKG
jgi:hypothetical protein